MPLGSAEPAGHVRFEQPADAGDQRGHPVVGQAGQLAPRERDLRGDVPPQHLADGGRVGIAELASEIWEAAWKAAVPGCAPARAAQLVGPVQHLEAALTYQAFLDGIEPVERPYHEGDPAEQIRLALAAT